MLSADFYPPYNRSRAVALYTAMPTTGLFNEICCFQDASAARNEPQVHVLHIWNGAALDLMEVRCRDIHIRLVSC